MDLSNLSLIFKIIIIAIVYIIIVIALRIMYKDIKNDGKRSRRLSRRSFGLEIVNPGNNNNLRKGAVIPIRGEVSIGRKSNNLLMLDDPYASGYHARVYARNNTYILEDLHSTNGTLLNGTKVNGKTYIKAGDEIRIGNTSFRVIG